MRTAAEEEMRSTSSTVLIGSALIGVAALALQRRSGYTFAGKVVLITGGSRGLGLVLARQLTRQGACVALMARDADELSRAADSIQARDQVLTVPGDVTRPEQCEHAVSATVAHYGRLDVLINNAGVIVSAPASHTTHDDFRRLMDVHFWGTLQMIDAALPHLRAHPGARIVNICSIGGKVPVPHLSAYCASKFAQGGLSSVLAQELRRDGITVCTVYPGLMRTGSHLQASFRGDASREFAAFALASGLPGVSMGAERASRLLLSAVRRRQAEIVVPFSIRQVARAAAIVPNATSWVMGLVSRVLPRGSSATVRRASGLPVRGENLALHPAVRAAVALSERAATRNNERTPPP